MINLKREFVARNPFKVTELPFFCQLYRWRKGHFARKNVLRKLIPGRAFLFYLLKLSDSFSLGKFGYQTKSIAFRPSNTQFHALYFPEYENGYETETALVMDLLIEKYPDLHFYDIGANWGYFSLYVCSNPKFTGTVDAFEPMPSTFLDLKNCVEQAGLSERIKVHNLALGTQESTAQMSLVDGLNSGKASVTLGGNIEIAMGRLERFYRAGIGLLKIDVEGFEEQVLSGAEQIIKEEKPFIIFESWADKKDPAGTLRPFEILARLGFSFFSPHYENGILSLSLFNHAERFSHREHMNVLAVHETRLEDFKSIF